MAKIQGPKNRREYKITISSIFVLICLWLYSWPFDPSLRSHSIELEHLKLVYHISVGTDILVYNALTDR